MDARAIAGAQAVPKLLLEFADTTIEIPATAQARQTVCSLGKSELNQVVIEHESVSRFHAQIEYRNNDFYVKDTSTNGTYVQTEDQLVTHVHRSDQRLWGCGWLSLGAAMNEGEPIRFSLIGGA